MLLSIQYYGNKLRSKLGNFAVFVFTLFVLDNFKSLTTIYSRLLDQKGYGYNTNSKPLWNADISQPGNRLLCWL